MMRKFVFTAFTLSLLLAPAWGWNEEGHRAVALIAEQKLSPAAKAAVLDLLGDHPSGEVRNLADSACWPDQIRKDPKYHHGTWHYDNLAIFLGVPVQPKANNGESLRALNLNTAILKSRDSSRQDKAIALSWVTHLLGDIHQPLHAATLYSADFPDGDRGGNQFTVSYGDTATNLHAFWDSAGGLFWYGAQDNDLSAVVDDLIAHWSSADQATNERSPLVWQTESHDLARDIGYSGVKLNGDLDTDYVNRAQEVSRRRLTLAGYRLAAYLDRLFRAKSDNTIPAIP